MKSIAKIRISNSFNLPVFTESIIEGNFYQELQKNGWCEIVDDSPDELTQYVSIKSIGTTIDTV